MGHSILLASFLTCSLGQSPRLTSRRCGGSRGRGWGGICTESWESPRCKAVFSLSIVWSENREIRNKMSRVGCVLGPDTWYNTNNTCTFDRCSDPGSWEALPALYSPQWKCRGCPPPSCECSRTGEPLLAIFYVNSGGFPWLIIFTFDVRCDEASKQILPHLRTKHFTGWKMLTFVQQFQRRTVHSQTIVWTYNYLIIFHLNESENTWTNISCRSIT